MDEYKKPYLRLFNGVTDALIELEAGRMESGAEILRQAQREAEELYIETEN